MLALALVLLGISAFQVSKYLEIQRQLREPNVAIPLSAIKVLPGFELSRLHLAPESEGSWISMAIDPQGRFIVSPAGKEPLLRLTIDHGKLTRIEPVNQPVHAAMGLLYTRQSLFLDCDGPKGRGIYRMIDNNGIFAEPKLIRPFDMSGFEHGAHGILLGPDDKLYVVCGDHTSLPTDISPSSPLRNYADDQLLPRAEDPAGSGVGVSPPGGYVLRMDLDGNNCEVFTGDTRNIYALAFNSDGELFGFDSDAETDFGMPFYRPIRITHCISGGEYGFRQGSGKLPDYYEDTLPATLNVGIGSPTGMKFAPTNCAFPAPWRDAAFMEDWAYGRIFAVHFIPSGATYGARIETILRGTPLNLTAMEFGLDGALYFITGGRETQSGLYRLTGTGPDLAALRKTTTQSTAESEAKAARLLRHELEKFQVRRDWGAIDFIWPCLNSEDRWIRYAARIALEFQDAALWEERALAETNSYGGLTALLALSRCEERQTQAALLSDLDTFPFSSLNKEQRLLKLRVLELSFIRQGRPSAELAAKIGAALDPMYPSASENENRELCQLLLYLNVPDAITKTLALLDRASTQEEQIYYIMRLRTITDHWTLPQRAHYLNWFVKDYSHAGHPEILLQYFKDAQITYSDGNRLGPYLDNFRQEAAATLNASERQSLAALLPAKPKVVQVPAPNGKFIKAWSMADLLPHLSKANGRRMIARGKSLLAQAQCNVCHYYRTEGGSYGPDLTAVGSRMTARDILDSIIEPSRTIADQYQNTFLTLKDGDVLAGRIVGEDDKKMFMIGDPVNMTRTTVLKSDIVSRRVSKVSPMPEGLLNSLTEEEIWDLIGCLKSPPASGPDMK